jgi:hypothetical protein
MAIPALSIEDTRARRAHSLAQVNQLLTSHQYIDHEGNFLATCPECRRGMAEIGALSIPTENLPRFNGFSLANSDSNIS